MLWDQNLALSNVQSVIVLATETGFEIVWIPGPSVGAEPQLPGS
jgi:hypothetical protein